MQVVSCVLLQPVAPEVFGKSVGMGLAARLGDPLASSKAEEDGSSTGGSDSQMFGSVTRLQALLKAKTGEVKALQASVTALEHDKVVLTDELVSLTTKNAHMYVCACLA